MLVSLHKYQIGEAVAGKQENKMEAGCLAVRGVLNDAFHPKASKGAPACLL